MKSFPLVDLAALHDELGDELEAAVLEVIRSQRFVGGPNVTGFESAFADYLGVAEVVAVANGTDAIELALRALEIEPGAEVLVPANTFIATAEAVVAAGAVPRFVDVDAGTGLIDLRSCEAAATTRTRAVIPVHLYGRMADMDPIMEFASGNGLAVIEDTAQAQGARRDGRLAGAVGDVGAFSFYPGKNLGAFGDAGAVVTGDRQVAERLRMLRDHGRTGRNSHALIGRNSRMDPIQAAVLTVKLAYLDDFNERRRTAAGWYRELLPAELVDRPMDDPLADVHHLFPILIEDRDGVGTRLGAAGIHTGIHYPEPLHRTTAFLDPEASCPSAERRAAAQLSLPIHPHLSRTDVELIASAVRAAALARAA